ncbi:MAG: hypothetical protein P8100_04650 [bacterium]|jgi:hypothetical protein
MKTNWKKMMFAALVILYSGYSAFAFEDSLKVNDQKSFDLVLSDVSNSTKITLADQRNNTLFEKTIKEGESFMKTFNLELLPSGKYKVEIENATRIKSYLFEVDTDSLLMADARTKEIYKPIVHEKGSAVYVTQFSPENKPLYIAIFNDRNELLHEETLKGRIDLGKIYDFSKSENGLYRFYLESNGKSYDELVYVEK